MIRVNIIGNEVIAIPLTDRYPIIEITEEQFKKIENGELVAKNGKLVDNTRILEATNRISELKQLLSSTDYQAIKYAEGELTASEYAPIKKQRKAWREEINELEKEIE